MPFPVAFNRKTVPGLLILLLIGGALYLRARPEVPPLRAQPEAPLLRMPFRAGTVVLCQQGNLSPAGQTHSYSNAMHAVDLSCPDNGREVLIVAAAPGTVDDLFTASERGDLKAGGGWGNHVKLAHQGGFYTLYAHLDKVLVALGDKLKTGDVIGTMGNTGAAGNPHLHFSLHQGPTFYQGVGPTTAFKVVASDLDRSEGFQVLSSKDFVGIGRSLSANAGHLYASENDGSDRFVTGQPGAVLATKIGSCEKQIRAALSPP